MKRSGAILALCAALALAIACAAAEEAGSPYTENEWNYVDGSMDVSGGIPEDAEGVLWSIREAGVLRVATEPYFPPQEFIDPELTGQERFAGSDMQMARRIAQRMGVELEIVPMEFSQVLDAVADGSCDLAISALSFTPGRAATVTMSKGYYYSDQGTGGALLIRVEDADAITRVEDLAGRDIVAQALSLQETLLAENVQNYRQFRRLSQVKDVFDAVSDGSADAAMVDPGTAASYSEANPDCGLMLVPGASFSLDEQYQGDRVAAKKGELQLMYFVNGVIDELLSSGEYETWYAQAEDRAAELDM